MMSRRRRRKLRNLFRIVYATSVMTLFFSVGVGLLGLGSTPWALTLPAWLCATGSMVALLTWE